ncbi:hypothetical protein CI102_14148 [Trichoderma harzianum]|nr:hypothetical protein CI102_14148 [Trichoderma harzianum]
MYSYLYITLPALSCPGPLGRVRASGRVGGSGQEQAKQPFAVRPNCGLATRPGVGSLALLAAFDGHGISPCCASRARHPGTGTWRRGPSQRPSLGAIGARRYEYSPDTSPAAGLLHGTVPRTARFTWTIPRASPGHSALELSAVACVGAVIALRDNALALPLPPIEWLWYFVFPRSCHTNSRYLRRAPVASSAAPGLSAVLL